MPRNTEFDRLAEEAGIILPYAYDWLATQEDAPAFRRNWTMAMDRMAEWQANGDMAFDAQPTMITVGNAGIPALFTTMIDPEVVRVALAPLNGAKILGEVKKGDWTVDTMAFPMVEMNGEVSEYGDFNQNGHSSTNAQWPQRQSAFFQTFIEYGERELDRAGAAKLNWTTELQTSATNTLNRYQDLTYHFGVAGLQNYGLLNDPQLTAALTPATKAAGGTRWITSGGAMNATANEVYADIQALFVQLVAQSLGNIEMDASMKLVVDPKSMVALTITNSFNVSVRDLLTKNFPNITIVSDIRYATTGGNVVQLIANSFEGADTGYCAYPEKLRQHKLIPSSSGFSQKQTSGTWGAIIRYPVAIAQMLGV